MVPLIPVMENHEGSTDMYDFFDVPLSNAYDVLQIGGNLSRLYSLNSELSGEAVCDATEKSWLSNDLALYTGTASEPYWKFAQYHEPFCLMPIIRLLQLSAIAGYPYFYNIK